MKNMWVYICSKKIYNEGEDFGQTLYLPEDPSIIKEAIKKYSFNYQNDIAIHDYDLPFDIGEYDNLIKVNELCKFIVDKKIDIQVINHIEYCTGERILDISMDEFLEYISQVNSISASSKKEFCLEYFSELGVDLRLIPNEIRNHTNWDNVFDELEISINITQDKDNGIFYYNHI